MTDLKDMQIKAFFKKETKKMLIKAGRELVIKQGAEALSARKLAKYANSSVGMIYNLFETMDNFVAEENALTLNELFEKMQQVSISENCFNNLSRIADIMTMYIEANPNLWRLLYDAQISKNVQKNTIAEAKAIKKLDMLFSLQVGPLIGDMPVKEKRVAIKVLEMSLFAVSGYLLGNKLNKHSGVNKNNLCKLLMNTCVAGLASLKRS